MNKVLFDNSWRFELEPVETRPYSLISAKNEEAPGKASFAWNDNAWEAVTLPHDWAFSLPMEQKYERGHGHYAVNNIGIEHADDAIVPEPIPTIGWYRKKFTLPEDCGDKRVVLHFDGIFRDSTVYFNGQLIDRHMSGYTPFSCDVSDHVRPGAENLVAVRCDASLYEGWWYEGAGIYRHTYLSISDKLCIEDNGVAIRTDNSGAVEVIADIGNHRFESAEYTVSASIYRNGEKLTAALSQPISQGLLTTEAARLELKIDSPELWELEHPSLYECKLELLEDGKVIDTHTETFGFRECRFDADKGFFLNGKRVQLNGACIHQDFACVGVALPDDVHEFKIRRLKEMGCNAYRSSHHAPAKEIIDACNRLGMLVMDENRMFGSTPECLADMEALVRRDRNAPSVILWSLGNEEHSVQNRPQGAKMARRMIAEIRKLDPTRHITYGGNNGGQFDGINETVDVRGFNYMRIRQSSDYIEEYHALHPTQPLVGSEETSAYYQRGVVKTDIDNCRVDGYDTDTAPWGSTAVSFMRYYDAHPYIAGGFIWTGFDYTGEPSPFSYHNTITSFGVIDLCGYPKDIFYYFRSWWQSEPVLYLMPHWNHEPGEPVRVIAYTNLDEVELFKNGVSCGKQQIEKFGFGEWNVTFEPGKIEAVGYRNGIEVARYERVTAGEPDHIMLKNENPGAPTRLITAEVVDKAGNTVPEADNLIRFRVENGRILGVGNGDPTSYAPAQLKPTEKRIAIEGWRAFENDTALAWDMSADRTTTLFNWGDRNNFTHQEPIPVFRDLGRNMWSTPSKPKRTRTFTAEFTAEPGEYRIDFERINGTYALEVNGECVFDNSKTNKYFGLPCSHFIKAVDGINSVKLTVAYTDYDGANGGIFGKVELVSFVEPEWVRQAHMGLCMVMVQPDGELEPTVMAEIVG